MYIYIYIYNVFLILDRNALTPAGHPNGLASPVGSPRAPGLDGWKTHGFHRKNAGKSEEHGENVWNFARIEG